MHCVRFVVVLYLKAPLLRLGVDSKQGTQGFEALHDILPRLGRQPHGFVQYAVDAIEKDGLIMGITKGVGRIFRCHPFSKGGYDPA